MQGLGPGLDNRTEENKPGVNKGQAWFKDSKQMGDLHLVLPALNLSNLDAGILMMMKQVRLMMFSLNMVNYTMSFLLLSI